MTIPRPHIADAPRKPRPAQIDRFGRMAAAAAHAQWCAGQPAPLWSEVFALPDVMDLLSALHIQDQRPERERLMHRAGRRGWVVFTAQPRSLSAGPAFFASQAGRTSKWRSIDIGRAVAQSIGAFQANNHRSPTVKDLADQVRLPDGRKAFHTEEDLRQHLHWLDVAGWVHIENGQIHSGCTAETDKRNLLASKLRSSSPRPATLLPQPNDTPYLQG